MAKRTQKIHLGGEALASRKFRKAQSCEWCCWWSCIVSGLICVTGIRSRLVVLCAGGAQSPAASALCSVASCKSMICLRGRLLLQDWQSQLTRALQDDQILTCLCPEQIDAARTGTVHGLQLVINQQELHSALHYLLSSRGTMWPERLIQREGFLWLCQGSFLLFVLKARSQMFSLH